MPYLFVSYNSNNKCQYHRKILTDCFMTDASYILYKAVTVYVIWMNDRLSMCYLQN
jgi:hypothetical protein